MAVSQKLERVTRAVMATSQILPGLDFLVDGRRDQAADLLVAASA
jgi:hypothetical protein